MVMKGQLCLELLGQAPLRFYCYERRMQILVQLKLFTQTLNVSSCNIVDDLDWVWFRMCSIWSMENNSKHRQPHVDAFGDDSVSLAQHFYFLFFFFFI